MEQKDTKTAERLMRNGTLQIALQNDDNGTMKGEKARTGKSLLDLSQIEICEAFN